MRFLQAGFRLRVVMLGLVLASLGLSGLWQGFRLDRHEGQVLPPFVLPENLAEYQSSDGWNHDAGGGVIEQGATYPDPETGRRGAVVVDLFLHRPTRHNGSICYLYQGEALRWEHPQILDAGPGTTPVNFDMTMFVADAGMRLVGTTECVSGQCQGRPLPFWNAHQQRLDLRLLLAPLALYQRAPDGAVEVMVSMFEELGNGGEQAATARLQERFARIAPLLHVDTLTARLAEPVAPVAATSVSSAP